MNVAKIERLAEDTGGATAPEYGIIASLLVIGILLSVTALGANLRVVYCTIDDAITPGSGGSCSAPGVAGFGTLAPVASYIYNGAGQAIYENTVGARAVTNGTLIRDPAVAPSYAAGARAVATYGVDATAGGVPWSVASSNAGFTAQMQAQCAAGSPPSYNGGPLSYQYGQGGNAETGMANGVAVTTPGSATPDWILNSLGAGGTNSGALAGDTIVTCTAPAS